MSNKKPPLTDYQKTIYTPEEQEMLKLGVHIVRRDEFSSDQIEQAKALIQTMRRAIGQPPLTEAELDMLIERAKNRS